MKQATTLLLALVLLSSCASAKIGTDAEIRDIDRFVTKTLETLPELPSIGVAVVRDGKRYARAYGYADVARRIPADADTGYYNGSNTKAYTAAVVAMLAQEGKIDLDAPVTKYLPELTFPPPIDASQLTLRRLLSHTSGIENWPIVFRTAFSGEEHTPAELVRILALSTPRKDAGFRYDNLGYVVASLVIERVTGKKWQDVLDEKLFEPLGMSRTTAYMSEARKQKIATPYEMSNAGEMRLIEFGWKLDSMMHAAGGIVTTPNDLTKFLAANLKPTAALAETQRKQADAKRDAFIFKSHGYGLGWYQVDLNGEKVLYHGGGFEGWRSVYTVMPEKQVACGALTNAGLTHSPLELVCGYVHARLTNLPDTDAKYSARLAELRTRFDTLKKNVIAEAEKRAKRPWMLTRPLREYAGRYENPAMGTLTIVERDGKLFASIGRLSSVLEPFTEPESARVELIPGSGDVLKFTPDTVTWDGLTLTRRKE
jgi:CubicO group peptidase (beta-lactamase class C family)